MAQVRARGARRLAGRYGILGRPAVAVALVALLVVGVGALAWVAAGQRGLVVERVDEVAEEPAGATVESEEPAEPEPTLVVYVDGAVAAPGVYELSGAPRVNDALVAAGGLSEGADVSSLNLAAALRDGEKVHVPVEGEAAPVADATGSADGVAESAVAALVNLNTASAEELQELPGVGEATARAIVEDRAAHGPFTAPEDLMRVSGIGEKKYAKLEGRICV